jgi:hypothetical protein
MKRFIFYALDQYTIKVLCRKEWEAGVQHGIKCEQQRIIKLLEPLGCEANGVEHDCQNGLGYTTAADLIAFIKGEN